MPPFATYLPRQQPFDPRAARDIRVGINGVATVRGNGAFTMMKDSPAPQRAVRMARRRLAFA
jgi:hypothetical protein